MIPITPHEVLQLAEDFGRIIQMPIFRHHQHAEAVAGVEKFGRHLIVRQAHGIGAHLLEFLHAKLVEAVRQGHAHPGEILVVAGALDFDGLTVQKKSAVRVETDGAHAKVRGDLIHRLPADQHTGAETVQIRVLARPQIRLGQRERLSKVKAAFGREAMSGSLRCHHCAIGIDDLAQHRRAVCHGSVIRDRWW